MASHSLAVNQSSRRSTFGSRPAAVMVFGSILALAGVGGCPLAGNSPEAQLTAANVGKPTAEFKPTLDVELKATSSVQQILPGQATAVLTYAPSVIAGDAAQVASLPGSYLGPIIRARTGDRLRVRLANDLDEPTIIHWHGMRVPAVQDGHTRYSINPGEEFTYEFEVRDRAGTYWFHPHTHGVTGRQVYRGLAGLLLVSDEEEDAAGLPAGDFDLPLVIQDRMFDDNNQLVYPPHDGTMLDGFLGDQVLVNGQANHELAVSTRAYRLRLLNGSNSRTYKLAWSDGTPLVVIATDGGLLEAPVQREYATLSPGERVELWADFSKYPVGADLSLESLEFTGADVGMDMMGMGGAMGMGGMMGMGGLNMRRTSSETAQMMDGTGIGNVPNGTAMRIARIRVDRQEQETRSLPTKLSTFARHRADDVANAAEPRTFSISVGMQMMSGMQWGFDGRTFQINGVSANERIPFDALEVWEFVNETSPMAMNHPLHIHGVQFQILERRVLPEFAEGWESVRGGYVDEGWKDTFLVMPGERVKLLIRFSDFHGEYVYHCHNLEHSDGGMMRNFRIGP